MTCFKGLTSKFHIEDAPMCLQRQSNVLRSLCEGHGSKNTGKPRSAISATNDYSIESPRTLLHGHFQARSPVRICVNESPNCFANSAEHTQYSSLSPCNQMSERCYYSSRAHLAFCVPCHSAWEALLNKTLIST